MYIKCKFSLLSIPEIRHEKGDDNENRAKDFKNARQVTEISLPQLRLNKIKLSDSGSEDSSGIPAC